MQKFIERIESVADLVELKSHTRIVAEDPKDDAAVNTAVDAEADYVVTGDRHLLDLKEFRGIRIVSVDDALREIKKR